MGEVPDIKSSQIWTKMLVIFQLLIFGMTLVLAMPLLFSNFTCNDGDYHIFDQLMTDVKYLRENLELAENKITLLEVRIDILEDTEDEQRRVRRESHNPLVLDQSYGVDMGQLTSNDSLTVYSQWLGAAQHDTSGIKGHHMVSAAWSDQDDLSNDDDLSEESWNDDDLSEGNSVDVDAPMGGIKMSVGAALGGSQLNEHFANAHRRSRVSSTGAEFGHGMMIELPGRIGQGPQPILAGRSGKSIEAVSTSPVQSYRDFSTTAPPPPPPPSTTPPPPPPPPSTTTAPPPPPPTTPIPRIYKRPELKSLGSPSQPPQSSTAIHLTAASGAAGSTGKGSKHSRMHSHWKPSRWSRRLHAERSFPLHRGKVRVNRPGLYLIYAQVSYADHHLEQGYEVVMNNAAVLECSKTRGVGHKNKELHDISCYTGAVLYIEQGDQIYIRDTHDNRKTVRKPEKTFFGLVKLTTDWI